MIIFLVACQSHLTTISDISLPLGLLQPLIVTSLYLDKRTEYVLVLLRVFVACEDRL
jgi:hypothetical protein